MVQRALEIVSSLGSFGLKLFLEQKNGMLEKNKRARATELKTIFTQLGPTFVKLGQGLSTRPDICPPEYLEELSELQVLPSLHFPSFFQLHLLFHLLLTCKVLNNCRRWVASMSRKGFREIGMIGSGVVTLIAVVAV